jgi:serine/threonine protein phosphatase PrpC/tRNA A-37 threonylcarbamoyl transferase component Bud32
MKLRIGQASDKGIKDINQDCHGAVIPKEPLFSIKGSVVAIADGISSSQVSQVASEMAVKAFLDDYYRTSDVWTVRTSAEHVINAINSALYTKNQHKDIRLDKNKGYVCTFTVLVFHHNTLHIFHVGDCRIYRVQEDGLEQLTTDHRVWTSRDKSYLARALGIKDSLNIDYQAIALEKGQVFLIATDGVYEFIDSNHIRTAYKLRSEQLDPVAASLVHAAMAAQSDDNLTAQLVVVDELASGTPQMFSDTASTLPLPPVLEPKTELDGYRITQKLHIGTNSSVFLVQDIENKQQAVMKVPSPDKVSDPLYMERFLMEEWIARRITSRHVLKADVQDRKRNYLYALFQLVDGQTLSQWLKHTPKPELETVCAIAEQVMRGLDAFHRRDMVHQDIRPENIMIDTNGSVIIIDFGSVQVAGLQASGFMADQPHLLGTALFSAPEYFLGEFGSPRSDQYALAAVVYHMLSGRYPYGTHVPKATTRVLQKKKLQYVSVIDETRDPPVPVWVDFALKKALDPNPLKRYDTLSEFIYDLRHPNPQYINQQRPPLLERNPVRFWQMISLALGIIVVYLLVGR